MIGKPRNRRAERHMQILQLGALDSGARGKQRPAETER